MRIRLVLERPRPSKPSPWTPGVIALLTAAAVVVIATGTAAIVAAREVHYIYASRDRLPDLEAFMAFDFPTTGRIYDAHGVPLVELADEYRDISTFDDIPDVVRHAILAAEDKRFFAHDGVDYWSLPRVVGKVRLRAIAKLFTGSMTVAETAGRATFPQGGSTLTQQLVRGVFLGHLTSREHSHILQTEGLVPRVFAAVVGAPNANKLLRKREELRLSLWLEQEMRRRFGSKRRAKEELLARYASYVYMGHGQHGFVRAASHYFGRPLSSFTIQDAGHAALLAGIPKAPRDYAPSQADAARRRRDHVLTLMAAEGTLTPEEAAVARRQPLPPLRPHASAPRWSSAVVDHVLDEVSTQTGLDIDDVRRGQAQVYSTIDMQVQRIASEALEHGLASYEQRHPRATGLVQGAIVVLRNRDGAILAESGGRQVYNGRETAHSDFNRARRALRQPGSTMKPFVYLAAFDLGAFDLDTVVPDEPISVSTGIGRPAKWISNYDGRFKGPIPVRQALAESRNAVAIWVTQRIGVDAVLRTARQLGVTTRLERYPTTSLGASEVTLVELAGAYRAIASGVVARPHVVREVRRESGATIPLAPTTVVPLAVNRATLAMIQEGLRGVVRMPTGTAHALTARSFPIPVMGKTGTTNDFKDALFVGSTYGLEGITVAVRIGFDDGRSLGSRETGGRVALPVFREVMLRVYGDELAGPAPSFPSAIEARITGFLTNPAPPAVVVADAPAASGASAHTLLVSSVR